MKPISITAEGFLSFKERTEVFFDGLRFTSVTGVNGVGKSSIISAVAWAIYGETRVAGDRDSVVNDYSEVAEVSLVLQDRLGQTWRIDRVKPRNGKMTLAVYEHQDGEWVRFNDHRIAAAQEKILSIVGISEDAFYSLMVIKQGSLARFAAADSRTRRSIIMGLLPELDVWSSFHSAADDFVNTINGEYNAKFEARRDNIKEIEEGEGRIEELDDEIEELPSMDELNREIEELEKRIAENRSIIDAAGEGRSDKALQLSTLKAKRDARNAETKSHIAALESELRSNREERKRLGSLESSIEKRSISLAEKRSIVEESSDRLKELEEEVRSAQSAMNDNAEELTDLKSQRSNLASQRDQAEESHQALEAQSDSDSAECLICKSPLTDDRAHDLLHSIQDQLDDLGTKIDETDKKINRLERTRTRAASRLKGAQKELSDTQGEISTAKGSISSLSDELEQLQQNWENQQERVAELRDDNDVQVELEDLELEHAGEEEQSLAEEIDEMDREHPLTEVNAKITRQIREKRSAIERISRLDGQAESVAERVKKLKKQNKKLTKRLDTLFIDSDAMEWVRGACTQKGVPNDLIASILDQIQDEQNAILSRLLGDRAMQVEFRQERELKKGGTETVLDIVVHTESPIERVIESFSGGEQVRLTLSNFLAMIKVFNERVGNVVSMLYLDEPFGAVDEDTIPIIVEILSDALDNNIVESILVVSHDPRFAELIPQNMKVSFDREALTTQVEVE